uniref:Uncharacterized protein n=1 Tax=Arundo donax TaxID=35708 RepID=A0A0A9BW32_ARUDO
MTPTNTPVLLVFFFCAALRTVSVLFPSLIRVALKADIAGP